ncbi:MAG: TIGR04219 family outer membrane beta-barrel protein [Desulfosalsimonadaceae bacterium]
MRKTTRLLICLLIALAVPATAIGLPMIGVEGAVGVWWPSPDGSLKTGSDNDFLDLEDDFSFSRETELFGRLKVDMPLLIPNAYVMANPLKFNERTSRAFQFGGKDFTESSEAELNLSQYDFGLFYAVPFLQTATLDRFNVDAGLNFRFIDAETSVSQGVLPEAESMSIIIPQVYLGAQFQPVERFSVEAEARGLTYKSDSSYSLLGRVKATAFGPVFVSGGYRYDVYDIEKGGLMMDFSFSGPFVETGLSF